jgi:hypothetical protein
MLKIVRLICTLITDAVAFMVGMLLAMQSVESAAAVQVQNLVQEAAQGHADNVRAIVSRYPGQVSGIKVAK